MVRKRGQVSIFILIGLFMIMMVGVLFFLESKKDKQDNANPISEFRLETESIRFLVKECVENSEINDVDIPVIKSPDFPLEFSLSEDLFHQVRICLVSVSSFEEKGLKIEKGEISYKISSLDPLIIEYSYPLAVSRGRNQAKLTDPYPRNYRVNIGKLKKVITSLFNEIQKNRNQIPSDFSFLKDSGFELTKITMESKLKNEGIENIATYYFKDTGSGKIIPVPIAQVIY